jgi:hypothetical protein
MSVNGIDFRSSNVLGCCQSAGDELHAPLQHLEVSNGLVRVALAFSEGDASMGVSISLHGQSQVSISLPFVGVMCDLCLLIRVAYPPITPP